MIVKGFYEIIRVHSEQLFWIHTVNRLCLADSIKFGGPSNQFKTFETVLCVKPMFVLLDEKRCYQATKDVVLAPIWREIRVLHSRGFYRL